MNMPYLLIKTIALDILRSCISCATFDDKSHLSILLEVRQDDYHHNPFITCEMFPILPVGTVRGGVGDLGRPSNILNHKQKTKKICIL